MFNSQIEGRKLITTNRKIVGNSQEDAKTIAKILGEALPIHYENCVQIKRLFQIYFNDSSSWKKTKTQRADINNKVTANDAWSITRTINGYCFGEPIKYVSRRTDENGEVQEKVELLSEMLDFQHNHDATIMATLCSSVCGLGYKLALPANKEEYEFSGVPFLINPEFIDPTMAFCVYSNDTMHEKVLGVLIGSYVDEKDIKRTQYTVWTKNHKFLFVEDEDGYVNNGFEYDGLKHTAYPTHINRIPLIEIARNAFRKGDWEFASDLFKLKNKLFSNRADDIEQVIDYVLVLINCAFANESEKQKALKSRVISLTQENPQNAPKMEILKNPLDQTGVQIFADYIDSVIETTCGIPNRAERGGGGHDTGAAVVYRNGFRDLENNAGMIVPKMDKAENEFIGVCLAYSHTLSNDKLKGLTAFDVRNKFVRSMSDDPSTASTAYATFRNAGMNDIDSLIASRAVTDPAEVHKNNLKELEEREEREKTNKVLTKKTDKTIIETTKTSKTDKGDDKQNSNEG